MFRVCGAQKIRFLYNNYEDHWEKIVEFGRFRVFRHVTLGRFVSINNQRIKSSGIESRDLQLQVGAYRLVDKIEIKNGNGTL